MTMTAQAVLEYIRNGDGAHEGWPTIHQADVLLALAARTGSDYAGYEQQARESYASDDIEIDDHPIFSETDHGVWVSAWVFVHEEEV